jgi:hypothetical protein
MNEVTCFSHKKRVINIPASTKKKSAVNSLMVDVLLWRKKDSCSEVVPQKTIPKIATKGRM